MGWVPKECEGDECGFVLDCKEKDEDIERRRVERNALIVEMNKMKSAFNKIMKVKRLETAQKIASIYVPQTPTKGE